MGGPEAIDELWAYTFAKGDPAFLHQHAVDAWTAQRADERTPPMALAFALIGLYLKVERGFTGRQVQRVHVLLAPRERVWPSFPLPADRGAITAQDVLAAPAGPRRDRAVDAWCAAVWEAWSGSRRAVVELCAREGIA